MNLVTSLVEYLRSSKTELEKVSWPSRQDTFRYSSLVLGVSIIVAVFFASLDFGLNALVTAALQGRASSAVPTETVPTGVDLTPVTPGLDIQGTDTTIFPAGGEPATPPATTP